MMQLQGCEETASFCTQHDNMGWMTDGLTSAANTYLALKVGQHNKAEQRCVMGIGMCLYA